MTSFWLVNKGFSSAHTHTQLGITLLNHVLSPAGLPESAAEGLHQAHQEPAQTGPQLQLQAHPAGLQEHRQREVGEHLTSRMTFSRFGLHAFRRSFPKVELLLLMRHQRSCQAATMAPPLIVPRGERGVLPPMHSDKLSSCLLVFVPLSLLILFSSPLTPFTSDSSLANIVLNKMLQRSNS